MRVAEGRRRLSESTMVAASSSPMVRMLMRQRRANNVAQPMSMMGNTMAMSRMFAPVSEPMSQ